MSKVINVTTSFADLVEESDLEELFGRFGIVEAVVLPPPAERKHEPSCVRFASSDAAAAAVAACSRGEVELRGATVSCRLHADGPEHCSVPPPPPAEQATPPERSSASVVRPPPPPVRRVHASSSPEVESFIQDMGLSRVAAQKLRDAAPEAQKSVLTGTWGSQIRNISGAVVAHIRDFSSSRRNRETCETLPPPPPPPAHRTVKDVAAAAHSSPGEADEASDRIFGTLRELPDNTAIKPTKPTYRFIACSELPTKYGNKDVFMHAHVNPHMMWYPGGTRVSFVVTEGPECRPQALDVKPVIEADPRLARFVEENSLDTECDRILRDLPTEMQAKVIDESFHVMYGGTNGNPSAVVMARIKRVREQARLRGGNVDITGVPAPPPAVRAPPYPPHPTPPPPPRHSSKCNLVPCDLVPVVPPPPPRRVTQRRSHSSDRMARSRSCSDGRAARSRSRSGGRRSCSRSSRETSRRRGGSRRNRRRPQAYASRSRSRSASEIPSRGRSASCSCSRSRSCRRSNSRDRSPSEARSQLSKSDGREEEASDMDAAEAKTQLSGASEQEASDVDAEEAKSDAVVKGPCIEVANVPDVAGKKGIAAEAYLVDMFNPTLAMLPDFDKSKGKAILNAWSVGNSRKASSTLIMEMQNLPIAQSASRILHGLDLFGSKLQVRAIKEGETIPGPSL